jgi:hypothetical protein
VLAHVDLNLQSKPPYGRDLRGEAIEERDVRRRVVPRGIAEPGIEPRPKAVENSTDRPGLDLYEFQVFGVSARRRQHELVERSPATEGEPVRERRIRENLDERPREDKILLDHPVVGPRRHAPPGDDVGLRDHALASTSTSSFTATRQRPLR